MQRLTIIGNLGKDAEVKAFNNTNVINFSVAVTENWKDKNGQKQSKAYWYECSRWTDNTSIANYLLKGCKVLVEGVPEPRAYVAPDGQAKSIQGVRITSIQILNFVESASPQVNRQESPDLPF